MRVSCDAKCVCAPRLRVLRACWHTERVHAPVGCSTRGAWEKSACCTNVGKTNVDCATSSDLMPPRRRRMSRFARGALVRLRSYSDVRSHALTCARSQRRGEGRAHAVSRVARTRACGVRARALRRARCPFRRAAVPCGMRRGARTARQARRARTSANKRVRWYSIPVWPYGSRTSLSFPTTADASRRPWIAARRRPGVQRLLRARQPLGAYGGFVVRGAAPAVYK